MDTEIALIKQRFESIEPFLDERTRWLFAAAEASVLGHGGITKVSRATGISRPTIAAGLDELADPALAEMKGVRKPGGGRKRTVDKDPTLLQDLESLIEPTSRGDPESPLRWTSKSVRKLARELNCMGHRVSHRLVADLLHELDYSLQANRKAKEGASHPDRDAQFEHKMRVRPRRLEAGTPTSPGFYQPRSRRLGVRYCASLSAAEKLKQHDLIAITEACLGRDDLVVGHDHSVFGDRKDIGERLAQQTK